MQVVKEKTEDGIFGTSGGIGFTKANELFVGRVAMFGFAVCVFVFSSRVTPFPFWPSPYSVFLSMHSGLVMAVLPCSFPFAEFVQDLAFNSWLWFVGIHSGRSSHRKGHTCPVWYRNRHSTDWNWTPFALLHPLHPSWGYWSPGRSGKIRRCCTCNRTGQSCHCSWEGCQVCPWPEWER